MTFPDERIASVCRDLGFVLNYELARMERLV
jgi:hypothetical protein